MKKLILIIINILLIAPFIIFFKRGCPLSIDMLPVWLVMTIINYRFSESIKELILYNVCLSAFATIGIYVCGVLYFKYVHWDEIGEAIVQLEMIIEIAYIAILTGIESYIKVKKDK